jgi:RNA polymerase sigma-70 factor (ECF subfamily)
MSATATVVERTDQAAGMDQRQLRFSRKAIDPDVALLAQLRRGEEGAAEALVGAYGDRVYRLALRITGNASDAEEVVQDTLWTVSRKIDSFRGEAAFGSWVYRITANNAYAKLRRGRNSRNEVSWDELAPDPALEGELKSVLCGAIDELPANFRSVFLLHDVEGLSNSEIAATLDVKLSTIKSRVYRARLFLRARLADYMSGAIDVAREPGPSPKGIGDEIEGRAWPEGHRDRSLLASV